MFSFSKQFDYAMQLIIALAKLKKSGVLGLKKFSRESGVSFLFLQRIARVLRQKGIITSIKGAQGGYKLKKQLSQLSLKELVEAVEGKCVMVDCCKNDYVCSKSDKCHAKQIFQCINNDLLKYFSSFHLDKCICYGGIPCKTKK